MDAFFLNVVIGGPDFRNPEPAQKWVLFHDRIVGTHEQFGSRFQFLKKHFKEILAPTDIGTSHTNIGRTNDQTYHFRGNWSISRIIPF